MKNFLGLVAFLIPFLSYSEASPEQVKELISNDFTTTHKLEKKSYTLVLNTACDLTIIATAQNDNLMTVCASSENVATKITRGNQIEIKTNKSSRLNEPVVIELPADICINVDVSTSGGKLKITDLCGAITVDASGHVTVIIDNPSCDVTVDGNGCSGSIRIHNPKRNVTATSNSGCIVFKAQNLDLKKQRISLKTTSGNVTCFVPEDLKKEDISIITTSGDTISDFRYTKPWPKWMIGSKNSAAFSIKTTSGDVTVSKI